MTGHRIVPDGSTLDKDRDTYRQRFHCVGCDLDGVFDIAPASSAAQLLDDLDRIHRERAVGERQ